MDDGSARGTSGLIGRLGRFEKAAIAALAIGIAMFAWTFWSSSQKTDAIAAQVRLIDETQKVLSTLLSIESGQRGYVLTGLENFLEPYEGALAALGAQISQLETAWSDADADGAALEDLRSAIGAQTQFAEEAVRTRAVSGFEAAAQMVRSGEGKARMDAVRAIINTVQEGASTRIASITIERRQAEMISGIAFAIAAVAALALAWLALRRQARLRETNAQFEALAENIPQMAWMARKNGDIFWYNRRWVDYTGRTLEEMGDDRWLAAVHPDHVDRVKAGFGASVAAAREWEDTFPLRGADETYGWFLTRAVPIRGPDGTVLRWFGTNTDVTHQRAQERELETARDIAENANRAKSQFIANMSHELRTPLTAVIGYTEMLEEEVTEMGEQTLLADLGKINANARHLLSLINDVLDLSKIEAERMEVFTESFAVDTAVEEIAATVGSLMDKKGNRFVVDAAPGLGEAHTDQVKLRQCVINLLSNAAKFTENGTIVLRVRREAADKRDWLVFEVQDDGIGMTQEELGRLFQRFTQADASTTRKFGGTGLGLAITKAFAKMLGGDIAVVSRPGEGSTFTIKIPAIATASVVEAPSMQPIAAAERNASSGVVLAIDDDPNARELVARFLTREGFLVRTAADGLAGLEMAALVRPDVILLDVTMPRMDGWSVLSALKADADLSRIPVVMLTVIDEHSLGYALGASDYLLKPVEWGQLRKVMDRFRTAENALVLAVDDDEDFLARTREILEREGYGVMTASNGHMALEALAEKTPDLILTDLVMPQMDGFAFIRAARARPDTAQTPIIVLTSKDLTREEFRKLRAETDEVIAKKEIELPELAAQIRVIVSPAQETSE